MEIQKEENLPEKDGDTKVSFRKLPWISWKVT